MATNYLTRSGATPTSEKIATMSVWVKLNDPAGSIGLFAQTASSSNNGVMLFINASSQLEFYCTNGGSQALIRFTAHTNNPEIQFVWWDCNTTWDYDFMGTLHSVDIINHSSYTAALGQANTMFGPQVFMVSDTVIVYVGYTDSIYDVEYMKTFSVILEGDTTYE